MKMQAHHRWGVLAFVSVMTAGCGGDNATPVSNTLPAGVTTYSVTTYPATQRGSGNTAQTQDLLTAGLGKTGLGSADAPTYADPNQPTVAELRRHAIYTNYRAILDYTAGGGYGTLYGPNLDTKGVDNQGEGLIPGREYLAVLDDGSGKKQVVIAVQIPNSFDPQKPCVVAGPSSGSRGVYGAVGTASEWGLKHGCAVALTDAGKGVGLYDMMDDTVNQADGLRTTRAQAGSKSVFAADVSEAARTAFNTTYPNRLAVKHAHSQKNPEKDWGTDTLAALRYALYALNEEYGALLADGRTKERRFTAANTLVMAGSVSNGGAAVLRAAEQDEEGLIDGVVAGEPSAQPDSLEGYGVQLGATPVAAMGKPLLDYFTFANLYQPCAALAASAALTESSIYNYMTLTNMTERALNRCGSLKAKGLVEGEMVQEQAASALQKLRDYGYTAEHDTMHTGHYGLGNAQIISMMYANAYGRFSVLDNICGMSAAQVNNTGGIVPANPTTKAQSFAVANGTTNGAPAAVIYNNSKGGAKSWAWGISPSNGAADLSLDAALCHRALVTGKDTVSGAPLSTSTTPTLEQSQAVRTGMQEVLLKGHLRNKPTLIVTGRSDALLPPNHASRAYIALNHRVEANSQLRYIEVTNAQHFDTFVALSGFDTRFIPLHVYFNRAMDAMYAKLTQGTALPPSQVIRTTPRGGAPGKAPALTSAQVPGISMQPKAQDVISLSADHVLKLPE